MRVLAPAKLNLCLYLGPRRGDGLHELCSLFEPLALADSIKVVGGGRGPVEAGCDEVVCPDVPGENLAAQALTALRERGWARPPLRVEIEKRIPVAAGLGGGSADAAAILRLARDGVGPDGEAPAPVETPNVEAIAAALGANVPSQLAPALSLVRGAGERVEPLPDPAPHAVVLLPGGGGLSTAAVFAEADRLSLGRGAEELDDLAARLRAAAGAGASPFDYAELLVNDLEPAARSLRPEIGDALDALRKVGAPAGGAAEGRGAPLVFLTGSGPTAVGLFRSLGEAERAAARLDRDDAVVCEAGAAPDAI